MFITFNQFSQSPVAVLNHTLQFFKTLAHVFEFLPLTFYHHQNFDNYGSIIKTNFQQKTFDWYDDKLVYQTTQAKNEKLSALFPGVY